MKIAVTGAGGLLGGAVVAELAGHGHDVVPLDLRVPVGSGWTPVDLRDRGTADRVFAGVDAIVHLAAWPNPLVASPRDGWHDNLTLSANTVFAALENGVSRFVYASSQSVLGLAWAREVTAPDCVPVDEAHPCRPDDWYSASKLAGEHLVESQSRAGPLGAFSLRFPVVWREAAFAEATGRRRNDPEQAAKSQWAYVDARDAARAVRLAAEADTTGYTLLNIGAPDVFADEPAVALVRRWYPGVAVPDDLDAVFDPRRAERTLGFRARYLWRVSGITVSD